VAGGLLRLIAGHPQLSVAAILSDSKPGAPVAQVSRICKRLPGAQFHRSRRHRIAHPKSTSIRGSSRRPPTRVAAGIIDRLLSAADDGGHAHPIASTFRLTFGMPTGRRLRGVYKHAHGAPDRIPHFTCAVPEHLPTSRRPHVSHPGCFATPPCRQRASAGFWG